jgi:hypothetical protein
MRSREDVEDLLRQAVMDATEKMESARREFQRLCIEDPNWRPRPGGGHPVQISANAHIEAMNSLSRAMRELSDFLSEGKIPAHLADMTLKTRQK